MGKACAEASFNLPTGPLRSVAEMSNTAAQIDEGQYSALIRQPVHSVSAERSAVTLKSMRSYPLGQASGRRRKEIIMSMDLPAGICHGGEAERDFVRALGGGCTSPIAAHAAFEDGNMTLRGFYYDDEKGQGIRKSLTRQVSSLEECRSAGAELAAELLEQGNDHSLEDTMSRQKE